MKANSPNPANEKKPDGKIRVSPSQIATFQLCARKWAFDKIDRRPRPQSAAQKIGIDNHKDIEEWLTKSKLPGPIAKQAIQPGFLPAPSPDLLCERKFERPMPEVAKDTLMVGQIDCAGPGEARDVRPIVYDFKTTGNIKYAMKPSPCVLHGNPKCKACPPFSAELEKDPQAVVYVKYVMERLEVSELDARWIYMSYDKKTMLPAGTRRVQTTFTEESIADDWAAIVEVAKKIRHHKLHTKKAVDVEPNPRACQAFGGCDYMAVCNLTPGQVMLAHQAQFDKYGSSVSTAQRPGAPTHPHLVLIGGTATRPAVGAASNSANEKNTRHAKKDVTDLSGSDITALTNDATFTGDSNDMTTLNFNSINKKKNGQAGKSAAPAAKGATAAKAPVKPGTAATKPGTAAAKPATAARTVTAAAASKAPAAKVPAGKSATTFTNRMADLQKKGAKGVNPPEESEPETETPDDDAERAEASVADAERAEASVAEEEVPVEEPAEEEQEEAAPVPTPRRRATPATATKTAAAPVVAASETATGFGFIVMLDVGFAKHDSVREFLTLDQLAEALGEEPDIASSVASIGDCFLLVDTSSPIWEGVLRSEVLKNAAAVIRGFVR